MASPFTAYASSQNQRFSNHQANLVDLVQRLNDTIASLPPNAQRNWNTSLRKALQAFKRNHPGLTSLNLPKRTEINRALFPICQSVDRHLCQIWIDTTMQRQPDLKWIIQIITNFRAYQAQPIQVYGVGKDQYGGWDGQHTALALYLIAVVGLGMKFEDVLVPVNEYALNTRGQLRNTFICNNSWSGRMAGKKALDTIDIVEQMIYGVEVDGVTDPDWVAVHEKWKHIRAAGMFLTHEKFNNTDETGAISRLDEFMKASVEVTRQFAVYGEYVIDTQATAKQKRPINTKEIPIIMEFLMSCELDNVHLTDDDIRDMAQHLIDLFDANFDAKSDYWEYVHDAIVNAWTLYNVQNKIPKNAWGNQPSNLKNVPQGYNFFWHQLTATWAPVRKVGMPKRPTYTYVPDAKDLIS